jgi:hypothetical protein
MKSFYFFLFRSIPIFLLILFLAGFSRLMAQDENPWTEKPELELFGFVDVFYAWDFNQPTTPYRQVFFFHHNRHNEFNLNLGMIKMSVSQTKYRANFALQAGTYPNDDYVNENATLKNVYEANAGISLNKKNNLWIDAGIFISHLGFESIMSIDNWTLTRSLVIENLPYYLAGAKLTYNPSEVVEIGGLIVNGWQRIQRVQGNSLPSIGTQLLITPNEKYTFNWSTFFGTDDPDSTRRLLYFNNLYAQMQFSSEFGIVTEFDFGLRQQYKGSVEWDDWYGFALIARYDFAEKWGAALRGEFYHDRHGVIVVIEDSPNGFRTSGISLNIDFIPIPRVACRLEGRWLHSPDQIYDKDNTRVMDNFFIVTSIAVKMDKKIL